MRLMNSSISIVNVIGESGFGVLCFHPVFLFPFFFHIDSAEFTNWPAPAYERMAGEFDQEGK